MAYESSNREPEEKDQVRILADILVSQVEVNLGIFKAISSQSEKIEGQKMLAYEDESWWIYLEKYRRVPDSGEEIYGRKLRFRQEANTRYYAFLYDKGTNHSCGFQVMVYDDREREFSFESKIGTVIVGEQITKAVSAVRNGSKNDQSKKA